MQAGAIATWISAYRLAGGDPSCMMSAALIAHPSANRADYVGGLLLANRRGRQHG